MQSDQLANLTIRIAQNNDLEHDASTETSSSDLVGHMHSSMIVIASSAHIPHRLDSSQMLTKLSGRNVEPVDD